MAFSSSYSEGLYLFDEKNPPAICYKLQDTIVNMLSGNSAVGIIGGVYEPEGSYSIQFISSFALNILQMDIDEFEEKKYRRLIDIIGQHDKEYIFNLMNSSDGDHLLRIETEGHQPVWVKALFKKYKDEHGNNIWVMSICSIQMMIDTINRCTDAVFSLILDVENLLIYIQKNPGQNNTLFDESKIFKYSYVLNKLLMESVYPEYRDFAKKALDINVVKKVLSEEAIYEVSIPQKIFNDEPMIVRHKFVYLDDSKRFIIVTAEDVTDLYSLDNETGCLNMNGFYMATDRHIKNNPDDYALIFFNIKNFKAYNEAYGFESGNKLLKDVAEYIRNSSINPILLGREESDHFICLTKSKDYKQEQLESLCCFKDFSGERAITLHMSSGVYFLENKQELEEDLRHLCRYAKTAQQQVNDDILHPVCIYTPKFTEENMRAVRLFEGLQEGLDKNQFKVYYQPIYDAKTKKVASAEALARWEHPTLGLLSPAGFVPLFEKYGVITKLDDYISKMALEFASRRIIEGKTIVPISFNFSRIDIRNKEDVERMLSRFQNSILPVNYCRMEITESAYSSLDDDLIVFMKKLHKAGAKILIDDFGSGYSSFSSMADYPYDYLKIDMAFARMINENKKANGIIKNIILMCHDLGVKVIAEGIETEEQYKFMLESDCDYIQGYYFSPPLNEDDFKKILETI